MNIDFKVWWGKLDYKEQTWLIVFGLFFVGITILWSGIKLGQVIGMIMNM